MRLKNIEEVSAFLAVVDACDGDVWLESQYGDKFNLKSKLAQYIAISALLNDKQEVLELFCSHKEDERKFFKYFIDYPGVN
jgi:hypothetical protein